MTLRWIAVAVVGLTGAGAVACGSPLSPSRALPMQAGTYTLSFSAFRLASAQLGICAPPPANMTVTATATLRAEGDTWVASVSTGILGETLRLVFNSSTSAATFTATVTGTVTSSLPDGSSRGVAFGSSRPATGTLATAGVATGTVTGSAVISFSEPLGPTWACAVEQAAFEMKKQDQ